MSFIQESNRRLKERYFNAEYSGTLCKENDPSLPVALQDLSGHFTKELNLIVEKLEGMKKKPNYQQGGGYKEDEGYNQALKDIINYLKGNE